MHGTVVHLRQVKWITAARLGGFPDISQPATVEVLERSMQATSPGVGLFTQRPPASTHGADAADPTCSAAVLRADPGMPYRADGSLCCRRQYVADRVLQLNGLCVADALKTHYANTEGKNKRYKRSDLLYNLQHGCLVYDLHTGDLGGREAAANTWPAAANAAAAQGADSPGSAGSKGPSKDRDTPSTAGVFGMRALPWKNHPHGEHRSQGDCARHQKEFDA